MTAKPSLSDTVELVRRRLDPQAIGAPSIENYADPAEATDDMVALCAAVDRLLADLKDADEEAARGPVPDPEDALVAAQDRITYWRWQAHEAEEEVRWWVSEAALWARAARIRRHIVVRQAWMLDALAVGAVVLDAEGLAWQGRVISTWDEDGVPESCDAWVCCEDGGWATSEGVLERGPVTVLHDPRPSRDSYGLNSGRESRDPGPPAPDGPGERL